jgi:NADH-quinone oxidoreductase subunit N
MKIALPSSDEMFLVMPEIWLVVGMCAVILVPFINRRNSVLPTIVTLASLLLALASAVGTLGPSQALGASVLHGMLTVDQFSQFFKVLLLVFTLLIVVMWMIETRQKTSVYDVPDFQCLLLGATFGMSLMASAANLLAIFMAIETASLSSFALAGFRKRHRIGTEGALKYVLFGAASSAIMVYGMSLIYGAAGSLSLSMVASTDFSPLLAAGLLGMFSGIAFKLSAVPLHFWCPDVFQGANFEVTAFLSVASKGAAMALLLRVLFVFGAFSPSEALTGMAVGVAILGGVTATWGNLLAYHQNNVKRLLAYSSIAHAGYMIMTASVMVLLRPGSDASLLTSVPGAILFYLLVYMFMNLGAFTIAAMIARAPEAGGSEDIRDYAGLVNRSPLLAVLMALFFLSLFGMPGLGGFMAKVYLMKAMAEVGGGAGLALIAVLLVNTLISLYYYLRPIYYMVLVPDTKDRKAIPLHQLGLAMVVICGVVVVWTGLLPGAASSVAGSYGHIAAVRPPAVAGAGEPTTDAPEATVPGPTAGAGLLAGGRP